jgi:hypothetical protein
LGIEFFGQKGIELIDAYDYLGCYVCRTYVFQTIHRFRENSYMLIRELDYAKDVAIEMTQLTGGATPTIPFSDTFVLRFTFGNVFPLPRGTVVTAQGIPLFALPFRLPSFSNVFTIGPAPV